MINYAEKTDTKGTLKLILIIKKQETKHAIQDQELRQVEEKAADRRR